MSPFSPREKFRSSTAEFPRRVLVIDEEPLVCWAVCEGLEREGFTTLSAETGADALAVARQNAPPDVVVIDGALHDISPAGLIRQLQTIAPKCHFLVTTTERRDVAVPDSDHIAFVRKPFDMTEIVHLVAEAAAA